MSERRFTSVRRRVAHNRKIAVLRAIDELQATNGYPPSVVEIQRHTGLAYPSTVNDIIHRLVRHGWVTKAAGRARSTVVTESGLAAIESHIRATSAMTKEAA